MWIKFIVYNIDGAETKKLRSRYDYLNQKGEAERIYINSDELKSKHLIRKWNERVKEKKQIKGKGRPLTRYCYYLTINAGVMQKYKSMFVTNLKRFIDLYFFNAYGIVFLHNNTNSVHAHFLLHSVDIFNIALRITKKDIIRYRDYWTKAIPENVVFKPKSGSNVKLPNKSFKAFKKGEVKNAVYDYARNINLLSIFSRASNRTVRRKKKK